MAVTASARISQQPPGTRAREKAGERGENRTYCDNLPRRKGLSHGFHLVLERSTYTRLLGERRTWMTRHARLNLSQQLAAIQLRYHGKRTMGWVFNMLSPWTRGHALFAEKQLSSETSVPELQDGFWRESWDLLWICEHLLWLFRQTSTTYHSVRGRSWALFDNRSRRLEFLVYMALLLEEFALRICQ